MIGVRQQAIRGPNVGQKTEVTPASSLSTQQGVALVGHGSTPNNHTEGALVNEIGQIVDDVDGCLLGCWVKTHEIAGHKTNWVDGPTDRDDDLHGAEGILRGLVSDILRQACYFS